MPVLCCSQTTYMKFPSKPSSEPRGPRPEGGRSTSRTGPKKPKGGPGKSSKLGKVPRPLYVKKQGSSRTSTEAFLAKTHGTAIPRPIQKTFAPSTGQGAFAPAPSHSPIESANPFPMRINKYLSHVHKMTRKTADSLVAKGQIKINDKVAVLGDKVTENDIVEVKQEQLESMRKEYAYYAYNKPVGIVTHSPLHDEMDIKQVLMKNSSLAPYITKSLFPVGRLDKKSVGLIILTNDGRVTDRLLNPEYIHDKEYIVTTVQTLPHFFKKHMEAGIMIGDEKNGYKTQPAKVELMGPNTFSITLTEGKRHQIRRMCEALRVDVRELKRIRVMNIRLGKLAPNTTRRIDGKELEDFLKSLGL
jgi:23S rRNA pseudouridine2604 synthase